jgi:hypothetical protein
MLTIRHGTEIQTDLAGAPDEFVPSSAGKNGHVQCGEYLRVIAHGHSRAIHCVARAIYGLPNFQSNMGQREPMVLEARESPAMVSLKMIYLNVANSIIRLLLTIPTGNHII